MRIAVAQLNTRAGDFAHTSERIRAYAHTAKEHDVDLLVFPLTVLTGQFPPDYVSRDGYRTDYWHALDELSQNVECPCLVPVVTDFDGDPLGEIMLVSGDGIVPLRASSILTRKNGNEGTAAVPDVVRGFVDFRFGGLRIALATTYEELDDLVESSERFDAVLFLSGYCYALDDASSALGASLSENRFAADALSLDAWFVGVGPVGCYGLQTFSGSSFVLAPTGELVASAPAFEESLIMASVGSKEGKEDSADSDVLEPELYNRSLHLWETLVLGLRDYLHKQQTTEAALVLDGSLASCLLAVLASDALGTTHVHVLISRACDDEHKAAALQVADGLRIGVEAVPNAFSLDEQDGEMLCNMEQALLAQLAHVHDAAALMPLDKTFLAVEAAPHRCMAADLLPFGDVYRSDLVDLAHLRNTISPIVPLQSFGWYDVPSIEGLERVGETAELRLERVDVTLSSHVEWERSLSEVAARQTEPAVTAAILQRLRACQRVRDLYPPCLVASSRPLFTIRLPQGFAWTDHVRDEDERTQEMRRVERIMSSLGNSSSLGQRGASDFSRMLEGLEIELKSGQVPEGIDQSALESALGDLLGLIQDMVQSGEQPSSIEGPFGPLTWGSPFSEN